MATKKETAAETTQTPASGMRRCIGSTTFGIEAHEAPVKEFPVQASSKDGLGRMCKPHWRQYTNALRKAAVSRKTAEAATKAVTEAEPIADTKPVTDTQAITEPEATAPRKGRRNKVQAEPEEVAAA
jgi:hypothetical protein